MLLRFDVTDDGPVTKFVGIDITRDDYTTHMSQTPLADTLLESFNYSECDTVDTPMEPGATLTIQGL